MMIANILNNMQPQDGFNIIEFDRQNFEQELDPLQELYAIREQLSPGYAPEYANKVWVDLKYSHDTVVNETRNTKAKINKAANYDVMQIPTALNLTVHPS